MNDATVVLRSPADLAGEPDPLRRAHEAEELADAARRLVGEYSAARRKAVAEVVANCGGNQAAAARLVGISRKNAHKAATMESG